MTIHPITLTDFFRQLRARKGKIVLTCFIACVVAVIVAFSIPKVFLSKTALVAEEQSDASKMGGMASMASLAGIKLGNATDAISPELYPDVMASNKFLVNLMDVEVTLDKTGEKMSYAKYVTERNRMAWWSYPLFWLGEWLGSLSGTQQKLAASSASINPERLNRAEDKFIKGLRDACSCTVDEETGVISIRFRSQDPLVSKIMVDTVTSHLQQFITRYRTNKARVDLEYYRSLVKEAQTKYEQARKRYAAYCDSHTGINLQSYIQEQENLENELQLAFTQYSTYKTQVLAAEAKVQERTPAFTVIEEANVSIKAESPRKVFILIAYVFLAFFGYVGWLYACMIFGLGRFKVRKAETEAAEAQSFSIDE